MIPTTLFPSTRALALLNLLRAVLHGEPDFEPKHPNQTNRVGSASDSIAILAVVRTEPPEPNRTEPVRGSVRFGKWSHRATLVKGAASPEEAVQELLQTHPPSAISTTYILPGDATSDVLKRTLTAFKDANYPNIKMVETFSYMLTAMLDGTDCEYEEGETILYYHYDRLMESLDKGFSIVLKKVDQLFEIVEHIGNNVFSA
uniref:ANF_receptor domain-containing protein n=1 Tax=Panagrellus redivivus TaxID=6233 RepID=A0A7E4VSL4_PANRE